MRRSFRDGGLAVVGLVVMIGILPLLIGVVFIERQSAADARRTLDHSLAATAAAQAYDLESYFERARAITRLSSQNPAFRDFYEKPGTRALKARSAELRAPLETALLDVQHLYPNSIGETCFIDRGGAENARVVRGKRASAGQLSPDESSQSFFKPSFALTPGSVYQSQPYISPDTNEWVISNAAPIRFAGRVNRAIVHFEITIESFRRAAAASASGYDIAVVDAATGAVVLDSRRSQLVGAVLGSPSDKRFASIARSPTGSGIDDIAGKRVAFREIRRSSTNANDWYIVVTSPPTGSLALDELLTPLIAMVLALLLVGGTAARRWTSVRFAKLTERVERAAEGRLADVVRNSSDMVTVVDRRGAIMLQTGATAETLGYQPAELLGSSFFDLVHPEDAAIAASLHADAFKPDSPRQVEWRLRHRDGEWRHVETSVAPMMERSVVTGAALTTRDIGTRKALEEQLRHRAFHDPLTQLPNRALFYDRLDHALAREHRSESVVGVVFVDLDDFKVVNDRYGHAGGDELLISAAQRLRSSVRSADTVARLGGDEFGILLEDVDGTTDAVATAERVLAAFREPLILHGEQVVIKPSLGIALGDAVGSIAEDVLSHADIAMYAAKSRGKGCYQLFDAQLAGELMERLEGVSSASASEPDRITWFMRSEEQRVEIESVLSAPDAIGTVYQPLVDLRTGDVTGYEALSRFRSGGDRPPNAWFAQAARCGLGAKLECKAVELAIARAAERPAGTYVSVNVSPSTLIGEALDVVLPGDLSEIVFEVTENELLAGGERLAAAITRLRGRGARIAIDDAGAGYAGLKHLMVLRPDIVKLDRGVVDGVSNDSSKLALIDAFVRFAREIGAVVCAEGIEELDDLTVLADLDVAYGQGYCLGRPVETFEVALAPAVAALRGATLAALRLGVAGNSTAGYVADRHLEIAAERLGVIVSVESIEPALEALSDALHADGLCLSRLTADGRAVETIATCTGLSEYGTYELSDSPATAEVLRTGNAAQVLVNDPSADAHEVERLLKEGRSSLLMVPIISGARTIGMLEAFSNELRPWSRLELARARLFGYQLGMMLEKFGLAHELRSRADLGGDSAMAAEHLTDPPRSRHRHDLV